MRSVIWERPEPGRRRVVPLSRERIVATAVALADAEGIDAVTLRRVAAELGTGPMRLYGYLDSKDDLLDLMVDEICGRIPLPEPGPGWRHDVRILAQNTQLTARRHPWYVTLAGRHPLYGPNGLRYTERLFAAVSRAGLDARATVVAVNAVTAYIVGFLQLELLNVPLGGPEPRPSDERLAYLARALATGAYPALARLFAELTPIPAEEVFADGLERVLDGVAGA
ncbi:TetR/AcrR family transcriptional regulator C-terminal domain-containing protein [Streptosporangium sp. NPDC051022]|uniref:TetR/AcrR family transcriptional regulator n=1 Tax=Streptosporangium sp. NPDC051022 TaxID=3155752 RepID=UPI00341833D6